MRPAVKTLMLGVMVLFVLSSCSSEKKGPGAVKAPEKTSGGFQQAPASAGPEVASKAAASIKITPVEADRTSVFKITATGIDMKDAGIEWLLNGIPVPGAEGASFSADKTVKGDQVQADVTFGGREISSNIVDIHDAPPEITRVAFTPKVFRPGDRLGVNVKGTDPDGDEVTMRYQWTKNGQPAGDGEEIDGQVRRGDKIEVRIVPFDGEIGGTPIVLKRKIGNMPPMIEKNGKFHFDGGICTYQVRATDPDGDTLTYSLKDAPSGMTIDPATGAIRWDVPQSFSGKATFTVIVKDGHGGRSSQQLTLTVS